MTSRDLVVLAAAVLYLGLGADLASANENYQYVRGWGSGLISGAECVTVDLQGNVYVSDANHDRVLKFSGEGTLLTEFGGGALNEPDGLAVDSAGNLYVADVWHHRITKFDAAGSVMGTIGSRWRARRTTTC